MRHAALVSAAFAALAVPSLPAGAQDAGTWPAPSTPSVLPRPDFHFPGNVGRTILDSDPPQFPQPVQAPKGAPNVVLILLDDAGFGQFATFGGGVPRRPWTRSPPRGCASTASTPPRCARPTRAALHHRPQPPLGRDRHASPRPRPATTATPAIIPRSCRHHRRGAAAERLHDRLDRQEPQHADLGDQRRRPVRPLGQRPRLRLLLRLQRRRHEPLEPGPLREPQPRARPRPTRTTT